MYDVFVKSIEALSVECLMASCLRIRLGVRIRRPEASRRAGVG